MADESWQCKRIIKVIRYKSTWKLPGILRVWMTSGFSRKSTLFRLNVLLASVDRKLKCIGSCSGISNIRCDLQGEMDSPLPILFRAPDFIHHKGIGVCVMAYINAWYKKENEKFQFSLQHFEWAEEKEKHSSLQISWSWWYFTGVGFEIASECFNLAFCDHHFPLYHIQLKSKLKWI